MHNARNADAKEYKTVPTSTHQARIPGVYNLLGTLQAAKKERKKELVVSS